MKISTFFLLAFSFVASSSVAQDGPTILNGPNSPRTARRLNAPANARFIRPAITFSGSSVLQELDFSDDDVANKEVKDSKPNINNDQPATDPNLDLELKALRDKAKKAHKNLAFENDFSYLLNPIYADSVVDDSLIGDGLKRVAAGPNMALDVGGQYRMRFHSEESMRGGVGVNNTFNLHRTRLNTNLEIGSFMRVFVEGIDAVSFDETVAPRGIDENRMDLLNAFVDTHLINRNNRKLTFRIGRQELSFGSQRFLSNLDWANTRRTFHGYNLIWNGPSISANFFYTNPLRTNVSSVDNINYGQELFGVYSTLKAGEAPIDFYYLVFNSIGTFSYETIGTRIKGKNDWFEYDLESAVQWGKDGGGAANHKGEAYTVGIGKKLADAPSAPSLWMYYDWASGARNGGLGYHHGLPLAHKYLGFMDFFGRRNISDFNVLLTAQPHERVKTLLWYHDFQRIENTDTLYNVGMAPFGTAGGSNDLGQEIDLLASIRVAPRANIVLGYSRFFSGTFFQSNTGLPFSNNANFYYTQLQVDF